MWSVKCEVWGGVTGYRYGLLRGSNGAVQVFEDEQSAQVAADECKQAVCNSHSTAQFWYEPIKLPYSLFVF